MLFFFYGTLIGGSDNPVARMIHARLKPVGPGRVAGAIVAIPNPRGWYPALVDGQGAVRGFVYRAAAGFSAADLARLDAYEDYDPARPARSLYRREMVCVTMADGTRETVETYRWNRPLPAGARAIPRGDFRAWLARTGERAFAGRSDQA